MDAGSPVPFPPRRTSNHTAVLRWRSAGLRPVQCPFCPLANRVSVLHAQRRRSGRGRPAVPRTGPRLVVASAPAALEPARPAAGAARAARADLERRACRGAAVLHRLSGAARGCRAGLPPSTRPRSRARHRGRAPASRRGGAHRSAGGRPGAGAARVGRHGPRVGSDSRGGGAPRPARDPPRRSTRCSGRPPSPRSTRWSRVSRSSTSGQRRSRPVPPPMPTATCSCGRSRRSAPWLTCCRRPVRFVPDEVSAQRAGQRGARRSTTSFAACRSVTPARAAACSRLSRACSGGMP